MNNLLPLLVVVPIISLIIGFLYNNKDEDQIFLATILGLSLNLFLIIGFAVYYLSNNQTTLFYNGPVLYQAAKSEFLINFFIDGFSLVYLIMATVLTSLITVFSKYYIHREKGYKRFFNNLKFFYLGLVVVLISGNFETLFIGWEILGVTSFFLIGFYRERYLPVKNAIKVVSLYRLADIALLIGIWISHHHFGHSINFNEFDLITNGANHFENDIIYLFFIPGVFLLAAMVKSAQFPFSSWLPRAMEGPTTSSAIFYGSLSVHIGVFLLIRTSPLWEWNLYFKILIILIGVLTCVMSTFVAHVQASVKTQIAYSTTAQIGIMFIEVGLGLYWLAMIHFVCHAFLRSYQLLVSPAVLSYRIHDQFFNFIPPKQQSNKTLLDKLKLTMYVLSVKEFNLDRWMFDYLWSPLKSIGRFVDKVSNRITFSILIPFFLTGLYGVYHQSELSQNLLIASPIVFSVIALSLILKSFVQRDSVSGSWYLILFSQLFLSLSIGFNEQFDYSQIHIYLSGIFISGGLGLWVIYELQKRCHDISLNKFQGHVYDQPKLAFIFVIACLGLAGFPITPTFLGEDLVLGHIHENQFYLLALIVLTLILDGLVVFRIYSRLFLAQNENGTHNVSYRSS